MVGSWGEVLRVARVIYRHGVAFVVRTTFFLYQHVSFHHNCRLRSSGGINDKLQLLKWHSSVAVRQLSAVAVSTWLSVIPVSFRCALCSSLCSTFSHWRGQLVYRGGHLYLGWTIVPHSWTSKFLHLSTLLAFFPLVIAVCNYLRDNSFNYCYASSSVI